MGLNVLVVDDSAVMRKMIIKVLRLCGLPLGEILEAGDGAEGLGVLDAQPVDLALVDINMPVMDGEEMIRRLREDPDKSALAVIVVSTEGSQARVHLLQEKGAAFVHKPFRPEDLKKTILSLVMGVSDEQEDGESAPQSGDLDF